MRLAGLERGAAACRARAAALADEFVERLRTQRSASGVNGPAAGSFEKRSVMMMSARGFIPACGCAKRKPDLAIASQLGSRIRAWMDRIEALPYFMATYPPHWKQAPA